MEIDLTIYNRILFDDLRPWLKENQSEEKFRQKLSPQFKFPKGGTAAFEKALKEALKDHPYLKAQEDYIIEIEGDKIKISGIKDEIFEPLIDIDTPPPFNHTTEFYYYLIKNEATRLMNNLAKALHLCETETDGKFLVNQTLSKVRYFLKETGKLKKELGYADNLNFDELPKNKTEANKKITDYILSVLKTTLIRLFLEIQEAFPAFLGSKALSEDDIFVNILGEQSPAIRLIITRVKMNDFLVKRFINQAKYNKERTLENLNETREIFMRFNFDTSLSKEAQARKQILIDNCKALENLLYLREVLKFKEPITYEQLTNEVFEEEKFSEATTAIYEQIEEQATPNKRLAIIRKEEQRLSFLQAKNKADETIETLSIQGRISKWLSDNKAFINANLHIDFSKLSDAKGQRIKTNLSVPQLAFLFKALAELNPKIFETQSEAELLRFISANFITKKSGEEGISTDKLRQLFNQPEIKSADFWEKHLHTMLAFARKIKKP